jgi:hypothetical protein
MAVFSGLTLGCAVYRPKAPLPSTFHNQMLADVAQPKLLAEYNAMPATNDQEIKTKVARRNQVIQELVTLVDQNYEVFESRYYGSDATVNFAGDVANLGLTGVSAVTGSAHLKSVLSAIAAGSTGIKTSYLKNYFDGQTRSAVVQTMRSLRATELATIQDENHMKAALSDYSLEQGLSDIEAYYNAGTIIGALQSIAGTAGTQQKDAQAAQKANSTKSQRFQ